MYYTSSRGNEEISSAKAITQGLSPDGGLFVPYTIPKLTIEDITALLDKTYIKRAERILKLYLTDFTEKEISFCVNGAYGNNKFDDNQPAPVHRLSDSATILELWHGPTCAFKDMALQLLPYLLTKSAQKTAEDKTMVILVATSGDTGKAALEGFKDVENTKILVFYPEDGVSVMQKLQMTTQEGENVAVCAIKGNFDDAQTGVKKIFTNQTIITKLSENNMEFSSANSINWGRLVPQIIYYISAYCDLIQNGTVKMGDKINIVVPTGNFGNILAAYYAMQMGIPVNKLICASNKNNILTDFIKTGIYDRNRSFYTTTSPSMDILISSNLERLLFDLCGKDTDKINSWMNDLSASGKYEIDAETKAKLQALFVGGFCDDLSTAQTIKETFESYHYLCDTHTAVALNVYESYKKLTNDNTPSLIVSTASPYKFAASVLSAVDKEKAIGDEIEQSKILEEITACKIPEPLKNLNEKEVRFKDVCTDNTMAEVVFDMLNL